MANKLILACAGAGKTHRIIQESVNTCANGGKILVITYTQNNQQEIRKRFTELNSGPNKNFRVKGLFSFLLEDIVRPYQRCIFPQRITNINPNHEGDPHKRKGLNIRGTGEKTEQGGYNSRHFLTPCRTKAHTTYLSKLACRIIQESNKKPVARIEKIYSKIYFDEVQDLVGWDYEVIKHLAKSQRIQITCVGDFRQTIYQTAITSKRPKTNVQKQKSFQDLGFEFEPMYESRRSIQQICDFADTVYANNGFEPTKSLVDEIPEQFQDHVGIYLVKRNRVEDYLKSYEPMQLRWSATAKFNPNYPVMNFGKSKGMTFDRVLIYPTNPIENWIRDNDFELTDDARAKLYVAITRARYSVGIVMDYDASIAIKDLQQYDEEYIQPRKHIEEYIQPPLLIH